MSDIIVGFAAREDPVGSIVAPLETTRWTLQDARDEGGIIPAFVLPGIVGMEETERLWKLWVRPYLQNALPVDQRVAVLCAALEDPEGGASPLHATGLSLLGQTEPVDLAATWDTLADDPDGRVLLRASMAIGQNRDMPAQDLRALHRHLGLRAGPWHEVVTFAAWAQALYRCHADRAHASSDPRVQDWLAHIVQAGSLRDRLEVSLPPPK